MRFFSFLIVGAVVLSGCETLGIAKTSYVDEQIAVAMQEAGIEQLNAFRGAATSQISSLETNVDELRALTAEFSALVEKINETEQATQQLLNLASLVEERLNVLPTEAIRLLIQALQQFLEQ